MLAILPNISSCWRQLGFNDFKNVTRLDRHEKSQKRITLNIGFKLTGKQNIVNVIDFSPVREIENHNNKVREEHQEILKKIIESFIFFISRIGFLRTQNNLKVLFLLPF